MLPASCIFTTPQLMFINIPAVFYSTNTYRIFFGIHMHVQALLRARPKAERVFAEYENFLKLSDRPTDRDAFQRPISFEPSYRLTNGFRHLKATFNKSFVLAL